ELVPCQPEDDETDHHTGGHLLLVHQLQPAGRVIGVSSAGPRQVILFLEQTLQGRLFTLRRRGPPLWGMFPWPLVPLRDGESLRGCVIFVIVTKLARNCIALVVLCRSTEGVLLGLVWTIIFIVHHEDIVVIIVMIAETVRVEVTGLRHYSSSPLQGHRGLVLIKRIL